MKEILNDKGFKISNFKFAFGSKVYLYKYSLRKSFYHLFRNKVYFDYFHGDPEMNQEFADLFEYIICNKNKFHKIRVTNDITFKMFSKHGLTEKLKKIYLGVDIKYLMRLRSVIKKNKTKFKYSRGSYSYWIFPKRWRGLG